MSEHLNTVNVIFTSAGVIESLTSFKNNDDGRKQAEFLFVSMCEKNVDDFKDLSEEEIQSVLNDGYIEDEGGNYNSVAIVHSIGE